MQKIEYKFLLDTMDKIILSQEKIIDNTYNFCLQKKDIINYKGFAVNKLTNKYITNIEYIPKSCPKITYLGTNIAENEGKRHYFLIKLDKPYKNLLERDVNYLPVYISTGANTGNICKKKKCIIPFFGVTTSLQNNNVTVLLLKSDFIKAFKHTKNFNVVKKFYTSENEHKFKKKISKYFDEEFKEKEMNEYKNKVGSIFFIDIIINNKQEILEMVEEIEKGRTETKEIKYLHYLNYLIGKNNFLGLRLQNFTKTRDIHKWFRTFDKILITKKENAKKNSMLESPLLESIVRTIEILQS
tara:strand:- start:3091 stop:3987 length:897 start_codon:yes stop_codon:yes gene_type:complete